MVSVPCSFENNSYFSQNPLPFRECCVYLQWLNILIIMSNDYVISRIKDTATALIPKGGRAILYGSRARGDARPDSDWDILVLLDKERITLDDMDNITYAIRELGWNLNEIINPIMYTRKEWQAKSFTPFYKNVTKEGIEL